MRDLISRYVVAILKFRFVLYPIFVLVVPLDITPRISMIISSLHLRAMVNFPPFFRQQVLRVAMMIRCNSGHTPHQLIMEMVRRVTGRYSIYAIKKVKVRLCTLRWLVV